MRPVERQEEEEGKSGAQPIEFLVGGIGIVALVHRGFLDGIEVHHSGKGQGPTEGESNQCDEDARRHQGDAHVGVNDPDGAREVAGRKGDLVLHAAGVADEASGHDGVQDAGGRGQGQKDQSGHAAQTDGEPQRRADERRGVPGHDAEGQDREGRGGDGGDGHHGDPKVGPGDIGIIGIGVVGCGCICSSVSVSVFVSIVVVRLRRILRRLDGIPRRWAQNERRAQHRHKMGRERHGEPNIPKGRLLHLPLVPRDLNPVMVVAVTVGGSTGHVVNVGGGAALLIVVGFVLALAGALVIRGGGGGGGGRSSAMLMLGGRCLLCGIWPLLLLRVDFNNERTTGLS
mmetsp:Transcript_22374/g.64218  ORF Transcript_22374/g.64218 Transcript_22374/m.64218 type:complete len:343 (-) Transcript_22374:161-1189(-)